MKANERKAKLFAAGWNSTNAGGMIAPDAIQKAGELKPISWNQRLAKLSVFECYAFGETEGKAYALAVNGPPPEEK